VHSLDSGSVVRRSIVRRSIVRRSIVRRSIVRRSIVRSLDRDAREHRRLATRE